MRLERGQFGMVCIWGFEMLGKTSEYHKITTTLVAIMVI
jgi:hypothetical protein